MELVERFRLVAIDGKPAIGRNARRCLDMPPGRTSLLAGIQTLGIDLGQVHAADDVAFGIRA